MYYPTGTGGTQDFEFYKSKSYIESFPGDEKYFSVCIFKNVYKKDIDKEYFQELELFYNPI